jgi:hypothetical protein
MDKDTVPVPVEESLLPPPLPPHPKVTAIDITETMKIKHLESLIANSFYIVFDPLE